MKILTLDIETAPHEALVWAVWETNVVKLLKESYIISFAAKWRSEKKLMYLDITICDYQVMLLALRELLDQADIVVAHNGKKFDIKRINFELMKAQIEPPSVYRVADTLTIVKRYALAPYNKLSYLCQLFNKKYQKMEHGKGIELWTEFLSGCPKAQKIMEKYNKLDVLATEELYFGTLAKWDTVTINYLAKQGIQLT